MARKARKAHKVRLSHYLDEEKPVRIHIIGKQLVVDPEDVPVWIERRDRVLWFLVGEGRIDKITFKGDHHSNHPAPFNKDHDYAADGTHVLSGLVEDTKHKGKAFRYKVVVTPKGGKPITLDPSVQVQPYPWKPIKKRQVRGRRRGSSK
jgi:hypothetical protein